MARNWIPTDAFINRGQQNKQTLTEKTNTFIVSVSEWLCTLYVPTLRILQRHVHSFIVFGPSAFFPSTHYCNTPAALEKLQSDRCMIEATRLSTELPQQTSLLLLDALKSLQDEISQMRSTLETVDMTTSNNAQRLKAIDRKLDDQQELLSPSRSADELTTDPAILSVCFAVTPLHGCFCCLCSAPCSLPLPPAAIPWASQRSFLDDFAGPVFCWLLLALSFGM